MGKEFKDLTIGDDVIRMMGFSLRSARLCKVEKASKLHLVVDGRKYKKSNGYAIGPSNPWGHTARLAVATPQTIKSIHRYRKQEMIECFHDWDAADDEEINNIYDIIKNIKKRKK